MIKKARFVWKRPNKMERDIVVSNMETRFFGGIAGGLFVVFMAVMLLLICYVGEVDSEINKICEEELGYSAIDSYSIKYSNGHLGESNSNMRSRIQSVRDEHLMEAIIHNGIFFVLICTILAIYIAYIVISLKRIRRCTRGEFWVLRGRCYNKKTEPGMFDQRTVDYYVFLGQDENSSKLYQARVSEEDFNRSQMGSEFIAVRIHRTKKMNRMVEEEGMVSWAYLCE